MNVLIVLITMEGLVVGVVVPRLIDQIGFAHLEAVLLVLVLMMLVAHATMTAHVMLERMSHHVLVIVVILTVQQLMIQSVIQNVIPIVELWIPNALVIL